MGTCQRHNKWYRIKCPDCENEDRELSNAVAIVEIENAQPIEVWRGSRRL